MLESHEFIAELNLGGQLQAVPGVLPCALKVRPPNVPWYCLRPTKLKLGYAQAELKTASSPQEVVAYLAGVRDLPKVEAACMDAARVQHEGDLAEVRGQPQARRALEIAAAGGHNCFL